MIQKYMQYEKYNKSDDKYQRIIYRICEVYCRVDC